MREALGALLTDAFTSKKKPSRMMIERRPDMYEFTLKFHLPANAKDPESYVDALYEAGCDDATIGIGKRGSLALEFVREAASAEEAVNSAIRAVAKTIPKASLVEIAPDLVDLADLAELLGCTRQNLQKYATGQIRSVSESFPDPVTTGNPSLYRLAEIVNWLARNTELSPSKSLIDLARTTSHVGLEIQRQRLAQLAPAE